MPATYTAVVGARQSTGTATETRRSPERSSRALSRFFASVSATTEPTPASSTIISSTSECWMSEISHLSWKSGSRVVRLSRIMPWVRNLAATARRAREFSMARILTRPGGPDVRSLPFRLPVRRGCGTILRGTGHGAGPDVGVGMARTGLTARQRTKNAIGHQPERTASTHARKVAAEPRLRDRLRYSFDNSMSRGTPALIAWLCVATLALILFFTVLVAVFGLRDGGDDRGFLRELMQNLFHALDPGTVAGDGDLQWRFLLTMLVLTIAGLFIVSALIGVIAAGIDTKLADLRRGRSIVLESDHTVILGWSDSIFTIVRELTIANESRRKPVIVVLADRDKVEMEEDLRAKVDDFRGTRVICRSGSPMDIDDLALSSHPSARSVILLAPEGSEDPDSEVIKTLLALTHAGPDGPQIVAEIRNPTNLEAARLVGADRTVLLDIRETVAKLVVQTSRQSGAAAVYTELFDYDGDEIYFLEDHALAGKTYAEVQLAFEKASVIGLISAEVPRLNPLPDTLIEGHTLIVVAEDDSMLAGEPDAIGVPDLTSLGTTTGTDEHPTQALVIGWNERAP